MKTKDRGRERGSRNKLVDPKKMKKRKKNERKIKFKAHSIFGMATRKASQCEYTDNLLDENVRRTRSTGLLIVNIQTFVFLLFGLSFVRFRWSPVSLPLSLSLTLRLSSSRCCWVRFCNYRK